MQTATQKKRRNNGSSIQLARKDIARVLDTYRLTMPEVMGYAPSSKSDETVWEGARADYEQAQVEIFRSTFPRLWKKIGKRRV